MSFCRSKHRATLNQINIVFTLFAKACGTSTIIAITNPFVAISSRCVDTKIHDGALLLRGSNLDDATEPLDVTRRPKLVIVVIDAESRMLEIST